MAVRVHSSIMEGAIGDAVWERHEQQTKARIIRLRVVAEDGLNPSRAHLSARRE
jgi:hypothetical protein